MDLFTYFQYAAVTAIIALIVIIISLAIKAWFDETTFTSNLLLERQFAQMDQEKMLDAFNAPMSFDEHVRSAPGMHNLN
jgi:hypothetical protein